MPARVDLIPYQPAGWSDKIVVTKQPGTTVDGSAFLPTDTLYVDFAVLNNSSAPINTSFTIALYIDNVLRGIFPVPAPLPAHYYYYYRNQEIGSLAMGHHSVRIQADLTNAIVESNEADNQYTKIITINPLPGPLQITSVSNTTPLPLTPVTIATTGLNLNSSLTVRFSDGTGFSMDEAPIRVNPDGSLIAAVPLYHDPVSHQIAGPRSLSIVLFQGANQSLPFAVTVQALPSLASYGRQLGEITHAFLVFQALVLGDRLNHLQAAHLLQNTFDTTTAQLDFKTLLRKTAKSQKDIEKIISNNATVISWGKLSDGTPVQFDKKQLDVLDRVIALYFTQQFSALAATAPISFSASASSHHAAVNLSASSLSPSEVMSKLLDMMTHRDGVPAISDYLQGSGNALDGMKALFNPLIDYYTDHPGFPAAVGVGLGLSSTQTAIDNMLHDISAAVANCSDATCTQTYVDKIQNDGLDVAGQYAKTVAGLRLFTEVENNAEKALSGLLDFASSYTGFATSGVLDNDNKTTENVTTAPIVGELAEAVGTVNGATNDQGSVQFCCFNSDASELAGVDDSSGNYDVFIPPGVANTDYGALTLRVGDLLTGTILNSRVVDLSNINIIQPIQVPPIIVTPPSCTYQLSSTGAHTPYGGGSGSVDVTAGAGCAWTAVSNASFIHITAVSAPSGNGTVSYSVDANNTVSVRVGTLTIAGQTFTNTQDGHPLNYDGTYTGTFTGILACPVPGVGTVTQPVNGPFNWTIVSGALVSGGTGGIDSLGHVNIHYPTPIGDLVFTGDVPPTGNATGLWTIPIPPCPGGSGSGSWSGQRR